MTALRSPGGRDLRFATRPDTNDGALRDGIIAEDEYHLRDLPKLSGWAIDIGAHIGTVSVALAMDHPYLEIVAVEALAENVAVLRENVDVNGLTDRVHVLHNAAGSEGETEPVGIRYGWTEDGYWHDSRYIGGMLGSGPETEWVPPVSLQTIMDRYHIKQVELLKIDAEGAEWWVLTSPAVAKIERIIGEVHVGRHGQMTDLHRLLDPTHELTIKNESDVVSPFTAVRRGS